MQPRSRPGGRQRLGSLRIRALAGDIFFGLNLVFRTSPKKGIHVDNVLGLVVYQRLRWFVPLSNTASAHLRSAPCRVRFRGAQFLPDEDDQGQG